MDIRDTIYNEAVDAVVGEPHPAVMAENDDTILMGGVDDVNGCSVNTQDYNVGRDAGYAEGWNAAQASIQSHHRANALRLAIKVRHAAADADAIVATAKKFEVFLAGK